jgi:hypothetical protein
LENKVLEKYFLARSIVVFSYATLEKFVKSLTQHALTAILDNNYFINNSKDFLCIVKYQGDTTELYNLLMTYKNNGTHIDNFEYSKNKGYFSNRDRIDSRTIAHISNILGFNINEPLLRIPRVTIDSICMSRQNLAHGDYFNDLQRFLNHQRTTITITEVNNLIMSSFKLTDITKDDLILFMTDFKNKIVQLLNEIDCYTSTITQNA